MGPIKAIPRSHTTSRQDISTADAHLHIRYAHLDSGVRVCLKSALTNKCSHLRTGVRRRATAVVGIDSPLGWHMVCARLRESCAGSRLANQRRPVTFSRYFSAKAALCSTHVGSCGCLVSHLYRDCRTPRGQTLASWNIHPNATRGTQCHGGSVERFGGRAIHQPQYRMKIPKLNLSPHIRSFGLTI